MLIDLEADDKLDGVIYIYIVDITLNVWQLVVVVAHSFLDAAPAIVAYTNLVSCNSSYFAVPSTFSFNYCYEVDISLLSSSGYNKLFEYFS